MQFFFYRFPVKAGNDAKYQSRGMTIIPSAAEKPMLHAAWRLNPPVMASTSVTSPAKNSPGYFLDSIVSGLISFNDTPPQVTNSLLNLFRPTILNSSA